MPTVYSVKTDSSSFLNRLRSDIPTSGVRDGGSIYFRYCPFPSSLFNDNGTLRTVTKADLANSLKLTTVSGVEPEKVKIILMEVCFSTPFRGRKELPTGMLSNVF